MPYPLSGDSVAQDGPHCVEKHIVRGGRPPRDYDELQRLDGRRQQQARESGLRDVYTVQTKHRTERGEEENIRQAFQEQWEVRLENRLAYLTEGPGSKFALLLHWSHCQKSDHG